MRQVLIELSTDVSSDLLTAAQRSGLDRLRSLRQHVEQLQCDGSPTLQCELDELVCRIVNARFGAITD